MWLRNATGIGSPYLIAIGGFVLRVKGVGKQWHAGWLVSKSEGEEIGAASSKQRAKRIALVWLDRKLREATKALALEFDALGGCTRVSVPSEWAVANPASLARMRKVLGDLPLDTQTTAPFFTLWNGPQIEDCVNLSDEGPSDDVLARWVAKYREDEE